jgi:hypothetical protein
MHVRHERQVPPRDPRSLDGIRMSVVSTAAGGEVNAGTFFLFREVNGVVDAAYSGGSILCGHLVGRRSGDTVEFRYAQVDDAGRIDGGRSTCELTVLDDGRFRLTEHFQWESREGSGTNVFEEVRGIPAPDEGDTAG